jgi:hypothetical protein
MGCCGAAAYRDTDTRFDTQIRAKALVMMGRTITIASTVRDHAVHANDAFHRMDLTKSSIICHTHLPSTVVDSVTYCLLACTACHAGGTACESDATSLYCATNCSPPHIRLRYSFTYRKGFGVMLGMHTVTSSATCRHSSGGVYIFIHDDVYICLCVPR